jgi:hypothetical protein
MNGLMLPAHFLQPRLCNFNVLFVQFNRLVRKHSTRLPILSKNTILDKIGRLFRVFKQVYLGKHSPVPPNFETPSILNFACRPPL